MRMRRSLVALLLIIQGCTGYESATRGTAEATSTPTTVLPQVTVLGVPVANYFQATCAACHGADRSGFSGPALLPETLTEDDAFYASAILDGRQELGMPSWAAAGLTAADVANLVGYLRTDPSEVALPGVAENTADVDGVGRVEAGPLDRAGSVRFTWVVTNRTTEPIDLIRFNSPSLSVFLLDTLPLSLGPGESAELRAVFVPDRDAEAGVEVEGTAAVETSRGGLRRFTVVATPLAPERVLDYFAVGLPSQPARLATWDRFVFVGYFNGLIDVFEFMSDGTLERVEQIATIASTPNHGPDGTPQPEQSGRIIGGLAVDDDGTLYVAHSDPRLNEGEFVQTGHLADLNSGTVTALEGPPGSYGLPENRRDLVTGLPRNVTNHMPLGLAYRSGELFIAVGGMTDSGAPDPSKPNPDTEISGAILRLDVQAPADTYPIVLTGPGTRFATADDLVPGILDLYATGVRNGFGLAFHGGILYLTDQGSDGGAAPPPGGDIPGFGPNFTPDHLHVVTNGGFLGQPNEARGELVLNDGSAYVIHVPSPRYVPPIHLFGIHNSATGIVGYDGDLFPDLAGQLLVGKFSGGRGVQALDIDGDDVTVRVITGPEILNVTDVAVGPAGEILIADFWGLRLLIATGWE
jgi:hypothetical protein